MATWNLLLAFRGLLNWPLREAGKLLGISPELAITFESPFDSVRENDAMFIHLPVAVRRQKWRGDTRPIEHCGVRFRVRTEGSEDERPGVWFRDDAPHYCVQHTTLFEGYARFDIPFIVQTTRKGYWHADTEPGTYLADMPFMYPHRLNALFLHPSVYRIGVDVIAGQTILATSEWIAIVTTVPSLCIERALSDVARTTESEPHWFRLSP